MNDCSYTVTTVPSAEISYVSDISDSFSYRADTQNPSSTRRYSSWRKQLTPLIEFTPTVPIKGNQVTAIHLPKPYNRLDYEWIEREGYVLLEVKCEDSSFLLVIQHEDLNAFQPYPGG